MKILTQTLSSMNAFLVLLVISYVGSQFKILRTPCYSSRKPFQTNLKLVIKKYFCIWNVSSSNDMMLGVISKFFS